jgi:hypothetical protein
MRAPAQALGLGDTRTTGLRLRARRFATVEAATRLARLRSSRRPASWLRKGAGPYAGLAMSGHMPKSLYDYPSKTP